MDPAKAYDQWERYMDSVYCSECGEELTDEGVCTNEECERYQLGAPDDGSWQWEERERD